MQVERVQTDGGSHIEPPLDQEWSNLNKLRWHAAVLEADTGIEVSVAPSTYSQRLFGRWFVVPGNFDLQYGSGSAGPFTFDQLWNFINGIELGSRLAVAS